MPGKEGEKEPDVASRLFFLFFLFFETKRVAIGGIWLVVFGSSASQAKDHLVTGSLKGFEQPGLSESILGASWSATGA